jgi:hypothetical protein
MCLPAILYRTSSQHHNLFSKIRFNIIPSSKLFLSTRFLSQNFMCIPFSIYMIATQTNLNPTCTEQDGVEGAGIKHSNS